MKTNFEKELEDTKRVLTELEDSYERRTRIYDVNNDSQFVPARSIVGLNQI